MKKAESREDKAKKSSRKEVLQIQLEALLNVCGGDLDQAAQYAKDLGFEAVKVIKKLQKKANESDVIRNN